MDGDGDGDILKTPVPPLLLVLRYQVLDHKRQGVERRLQDGGG